MKKSIVLFMIVVMLFTMFGCDNSADVTDVSEESLETTNNDQEVKDYPSFALVANDTIGDRGFVDMGYDGIEKAAEEFGVEWKFFSCNNDSSVYLDTLKAAAENYDIIFVIPGYFFEAELAEVSELYPDKTYIYVDGASDLENVKSCSFAQNEGAFLAGVLAANLSETNTVGFVGGADMAVIHDYEVGFTQGVEWAGLGTEVIIRYTNDHYDAALGKVTAQASFEEGADVIFQAAGPAGLGVLEAAKDYGFTAIGVDTDQGYLQEGFVASSMLKRVDTAVYDIVSQICNDEELEDAYVYNVANEGISLADNEFYQEMVSKEIQEKIAEAVESITNGTIVVESYF